MASVSYCKWKAISFFWRSWWIRASINCKEIASVAAGMVWVAGKALASLGKWDVVGVRTCGREACGGAD
jgi:hypothetical protein